MKPFLKVIIWLFVIPTSAISGLFGLYILSYSATHPGFSAIFYVPVAVLFFSYPALIIGLILSEKIGRSIGFGLFYPEGHTPPPPEFPLIKALVSQGEYREAEFKMLELLAKDPENPDVVMLMSRFYLDDTGAADKCIKLLAHHFRNTKRKEGDVVFAMMLVDALIQENHDEKAIAFLEKEVGMNYLPREKNRIVTRLENLKGKHDAD